MEWIRDGESGLVVAPRDAEGLAAAMMRYAEDPAFLQSAGQAALDNARKVAGFETNMEYVGAIFDHLAGKGDFPAEVSLAGIRGAGERDTP